MSEFTYFLRQPPAGELLKNLAELVVEISPNKNITLFHVQSGIGEFKLLGNSNAINSNTLLERLEYKTALEALGQRSYLEIISVSLNTDDGYSMNIKQTPSFNIYLSTNGFRANEAKHIAPIVDALHKRFTLLRKDAALEFQIPEFERGALQTARTILLEFSSQAARLSQLGAEGTQRINESLIEKTDELENRFQQKRSELELEFQTKAKALEQREELFRKEKSLLDARENTVVRRDLLGKIEKILQEQRKIDISDATLRKRLPIHYICATSMVIGLSAAAAFSYKVLNGSNSDWHTIIPLGTGTLLFVSTAVFYLRWNDQWFKDHARAEFENRRFYLDIVRASWIAELLFEWKDKKEVPFPEQLIASYTTKLFETGSAAQATKHPIDDLKTIAANVSEIKFSQKEGFSLKRKAEDQK